MSLITPFLEDESMRRALVACLALSFGGAPLGVFLALRRMSLMGDALSHGILPGVAIAFIAFGMSPWLMMAGGLGAGIVIACVAGIITRLTPLKEDASLTGVYMIALAGGVLLLATHGGNDEIVHALFGDIFALNQQSLWLVIGIAGVTMPLLALIYRCLIVECFDPCFLRVAGGRGALYHQLLLVLVVTNLVAAFQAMGTLMGLGLLMVPAITTRLWTKNIDHAVILAIALTLLSSVSGLLVSYHWQLPPGPSIVLIAGGLYLLSVFCGINGGILTRLLPHKHLAG